MVKKRNVEDFLKILEEELPTTVNKTVSKCQEQQRRKKIVQLPSREEIRVLYSFVEKCMMESFSQVQFCFNLENVGFNNFTFDTDI